MCFRKTSQKHSLQAMTAVWLLPVVTLTVAASSGGVLARALQKYSQLHALVSATVAVFLVTVGLTLAFMILTIYLLRLIVHGLPPGHTILSVFLPLGPTAQSGFAVLLIGQNFKSLLPLDHGTSEALRSTFTGDAINVICICTSFLLWSLASMWIVYALLAVHGGTRQNKVPFKLPFWGLVFPNVRIKLEFPNTTQLTLFSRVCMQTLPSISPSPSTLHFSEFSALSMRSPLCFSGCSSPSEHWSWCITALNLNLKTLILHNSVKTPSHADALCQ